MVVEKLIVHKELLLSPFIIFFFYTLPILKRCLWRIFTELWFFCVTPSKLYYIQTLDFKKRKKKNCSKVCCYLRPFYSNRVVTYLFFKRRCEEFFWSLVHWKFWFKNSWSIGCTRIRITIDTGPRQSPITTIPVTSRFCWQIRTRNNKQIRNNKSQQHFKRTNRSTHLPLNFYNVFHFLVLIH